MTIKVQNGEVRIQIQSPESTSPESSGSPVEESECPPRSLIWPYCYAPPFQTMQSWFGYHPGDGRAYPRPLLDPWRNPTPQWIQPFPVMESAVHRVGNSIDSYTQPHWSYGRQHVESPEGPDHKPIIIEKEDDDERMDSPPPEKTTQTCKKPEQSVPEVEEKPPDKNLLSDPQQPEPPPPEPKVLIIQDVVIQAAALEANETPVVEQTSEVEPANQIEQSETVFVPERNFTEVAPPELPEVRNNLLWLSNVILSIPPPDLAATEPGETPKKDETSAFDRPGEFCM